MKARGQKGFTLLEVMVALSILAVSLTWMVEAMMRAIATENHAKLISTATFLARARIVEMEDDLLEMGFTDDSIAKEDTGDFEEKGFKRFKWSTVIDKIELPNTDQVQTLVSQGLQAQQGAMMGAAGLTPPPPVDPSAMMAGAPSSPGGAQSAGMLGSQFGIIKDVLEQSIRRVRVKIAWFEDGVEKSVEITQYLTDPRRVDQSIMMGMPGGGAPGANGQNPANGTTPATGGPAGMPATGMPSTGFGTSSMGTGR